MTTHVHDMSKFEPCVAHSLYHSSSETVGNCFTDLIVYNICSWSGELSASSEQWLKKVVAVWSVLLISNFKSLTGQLSQSELAYILLSDVASPPSSPPYQFVSGFRVTERRILSHFHHFWTEMNLNFNCWWNFNPRTRNGWRCCTKREDVLEFALRKGKCLFCLYLMLKFQFSIQCFICFSECFVTHNVDISINILEMSIISGTYAFERVFMILLGLSCGHFLLTFFYKYWRSTHVKFPEMCIEVLLWNTVQIQLFTNGFSALFC